MSSETPFTPGLACVLLSLPYLEYLIAKFEALYLSGYEDVPQHMTVQVVLMTLLQDIKTRISIKHLKN